MMTVSWQVHHFFYERYWNTASHWNALLFLKRKLIFFLLETLGTFSKDRSGPSSPFEPTILFWMSAACVWALSWCLSISPGCPNLISASSQNFLSPERKQNKCHSNSSKNNNALSRNNLPITAAVPTSRVRSRRLLKKNSSFKLAHVVGMDRVFLLKPQVRVNKWKMNRL